MSVGRRRKEGGRREGRKGGGRGKVGGREGGRKGSSDIHCQFVLSGFLSPSLTERVSVGGCPGSSSARVSIPLQTTAPAFLQPTSFCCFIFLMQPLSLLPSLILRFQESLIKSTLVLINWVVHGLKC